MKDPAHAEEELFIAQDSEITMECNPATLTAEKLMKYRKLGVNRLSIEPVLR
ncbi:MAG: hypothetical protein ACLTK0_03000 [Anaerovoracaceae bacterium]